MVRTFSATVWWFFPSSFRLGRISRPRDHGMASNHLTARKYPPTKPATTITDRPTVHCYCGQRMTRRGCRCVIVMRLCKRLRRTRCITYITHFRHTSTRKHAGLQERLHYDVVVFSFLFGRLKMMLHAHAPRCRDHSHTHTRTRGRAHAVRLLPGFKGSLRSAPKTTATTWHDSARTSRAAASVVISPSAGAVSERAHTHTHTRDAHQARWNAVAVACAGSWICPPHAANAYIMWASGPAHRIITVISYIICWARICVDIDIDWFLGRLQVVPITLAAKRARVSLRTKLRLKVCTVLQQYIFKFVAVHSGWILAHMFSSARVSSRRDCCTLIDKIESYYYRHKPSRMHARINKHMFVPSLVVILNANNNNHMHVVGQMLLLDLVCVWAFFHVCN